MANNLNLTAEQLDAYLGKSIDEICPLGFGKVKDKHNHCAHFVGHALTLNDKTLVGDTCAIMVYQGQKHRNQSACIRVVEFFNLQTMQLAEPDEKGCLAFLTMENNV